MKKIILILIFLFCVIKLSAQDSIQQIIEKEYPLTFEKITINARNVWVSLYDEQLIEINLQCNALYEYIQLEKHYPDSIFIPIKIRTFERWLVNENWRICEENLEPNSDLYFNCLDANWMRLVKKIKKKL
jgi:hypothetical protein